jgi:drug/metabolite transporter (DMT)-like permease
MTTLSVVLALLAAFGQATASVLQRRAAVDEERRASSARFFWLSRLVRRPLWVWGAVSLGLASACQAAALATGPLSVVQPVQTTELLFALMVGSVVFARRPDMGTWWAFVALAGGLAAFLRLAEPSVGRSTVPADRWLLAAGAISAAVLLLIAVSLRLPSAGRAAVLGTATAIGFSCTAALVKDALGRWPDVQTAWQTYAALAVGVSSFLLLQVTLRAGTLAASEPALVLGDALLSTILGAALFDERITVGVRAVPEAVALIVLVLGSVHLVRSPLISGSGEELW